jgi:alkanesulfonate monooxygenase SsuD/methylene tetrahydromethanopterin reductase-like flavin-dependent oxidoreductase (luciferase family)
MTLSIIRFDMRAPGLDPSEANRLYGAALEMATWADGRGFDLVVLSEHHGTDDGYLPSPLVMAAAVAGATTRIPINIAALLVCLHDPLRLAEDIAVVDQLSNGRISIVAGLGYRRAEYEMFDEDWTRRGKLLDECLETLVQAWTGEPFTHQGRTVRVTPRPLQQPHPMVMIGGSGPKAAKRAARFGFSFFPPIADDELAEVYHQECERLGTTPGMVVAPHRDQPGTVVVAEDPDRAWSELGPHLLHDAMTYHSWQTDDIRSSVNSHAGTVEELRAEGVYRILTPDEAVELGTRLGPMGGFTHHPLCGGIPPELAWPGLELYVDRVLPRLKAADA